MKGRRKREGKGEEEVQQCESCHSRSTQDLLNNYYCGCVMGWEGKNCSVETNECVNRPCLNGATCNVSYIHDTEAACITNRDRCSTGT